MIRGVIIEYQKIQKRGADSTFAIRLLQMQDATVRLDSPSYGIKKLADVERLVPQTFNQN